MRMMNPTRRICTQVLFLAAIDVSMRLRLPGRDMLLKKRRGGCRLQRGWKSGWSLREPLVRQPVAIEFDDTGRLWVIQYLQYPNPSGLKRVTVDRYSRTAYDRVPEPPPRGPKGADCITILEDVDGDGRIDRTHEFVTGLNLASGLAFGDGGVFVLQTPYLLFYADRDHDDRPDGDPEVLLTGFGMEDAHSVANSLTWGPDGWLYGLTRKHGHCESAGNRVPARVYGATTRRPSDSSSSARAGAICGGWISTATASSLPAPTSAASSCFTEFREAITGRRSESTGRCTIPYTFGYFDHVRHSDLSGGHVSVGGLFYEADALPQAWRGRYIAADLLDHSVHAHDVQPLGSTLPGQAGRRSAASQRYVVRSDGHDARPGRHGSTLPTGTTGEPHIPTRTPIGTEATAESSRLARPGRSHYPGSTAS